MVKIKKVKGKKMLKVLIIRPKRLNAYISINNKNGKCIYPYLIYDI